MGWQALKAGFALALIVFLLQCILRWKQIKVGVQGMKRIAPGDLIAVTANGRYYYALILDKIKLFGGNWSYVFHATTEEKVFAPEEILGDEKPGFHAFVDFIWAKRESRLEHIARNVDLVPYNSIRYLKDTHNFAAKSPIWFISDMSFQVVRQVAELTERKKAIHFLCVLMILQWLSVSIKSGSQIWINEFEL
ncbi:MAG: hypothetical protein ACRYFS_09885 [Janthinobacterium lividum]